MKLSSGWLRGKTSGDAHQQGCGAAALADMGQETAPEQPCSCGQAVFSPSHPPTAVVVQSSLWPRLATAGAA